jgi:lipoprotein NlpI
VVAKWKDGWPKTIGLYLSGALPEKDFLAQAAQGTAKTVSGQQCQADYYIGITRLLAGDTAAAKEFFEKCLATNVTNFFVFTFARAELARLTEQK